MLHSVERPCKYWLDSDYFVSSGWIMPLGAIWIFLSYNLLYWMIQSNWLQLHANKIILTNGSFKDGIEILTNGSLHSRDSIFQASISYNEMLKFPIRIYKTNMNNRYNYMSYSLLSFILFRSNNTWDITRIVPCSILCLDKALISKHTLICMWLTCINHFLLITFKHLD